MMAVAYEGMAIPLFWKALPKAGIASALEHQQIIQHFVKTFGQTRIAGILADREFASGALLRWLNQQRLPFYIRIKENSELRIRRKKFQSAKKLFRYVSVKQQSVFAMTIELFQQKVYLSASRSEKGELMIVATNQDPRQAIAVYLRRWEIENLFHYLKTRGFRFEETRLTEVERIEKMMGWLTIGVAWAHKVGEWRAMQKPIVFNQYRQSYRPQYSYFRYGFDGIRKLLLCVSQKQKKLFSFVLSFFNQDQL